MPSRSEIRESNRICRERDARRLKLEYQIGDCLAWIIGPQRAPEITKALIVSLLSQQSDRLYTMAERAKSK